MTETKIRINFFLFFFSQLSSKGKKFSSDIELEKKYSMIRRQRFSLSRRANITINERMLWTNVRANHVPFCFSTNTHTHEVSHLPPGRSWVGFFGAMAPATHLTIIDKRTCLYPSPRYHWLVSLLYLLFCSPLNYRRFTRGRKKSLSIIIFLRLLSGGKFLLLL